MKSQNAVALVVISAIACDVTLEQRTSHTLAQPLQPHTEIAMNCPTDPVTLSVISASGGQVGYRLDIIPQGIVVGEDGLSDLIVDLAAIGPSGDVLSSKNRKYEEVEDFLHNEIVLEFSKESGFSRALLKKGEAFFTGNNTVFFFREEQLRRLRMA